MAVTLHVFCLEEHCSSGLSYSQETHLVPDGWLVEVIDSPFHPDSILFTGLDD